MKKKYLKDLVGKKFKPFKADIHIHGGKYHYDYQDFPKIRVVKEVKIKKENGCKWIYWYWTPEYDTGNYGFDCGYSGIMIENKNGKCNNFKFDNLYLNAQ